MIYGVYIYIYICIPQHLELQQWITECRRMRGSVWPSSKAPKLRSSEAPKLGKDGRYPLDLYRIYIGINRISEDLFRIYLGINRIGIYRMDLIEFNRILLLPYFNGDFMNRTWDKPS